MLRNLQREELHPGLGASGGCCCAADASLGGLSMSISISRVSAICRSTAGASVKASIVKVSKCGHGRKEQRAVRATGGMA